MNIALDIGHANNTGSRGNGLEEHATAKTIADHLAPMLRAQGHAITVIDFPRMDNDDDLAATVKAINAGGFDISISLHCDSSDSATACGAHVCHHRNYHDDGSYTDSPSGKRLAKAIAGPLCKLMPGRADHVQARPDRSCKPNQPVCAPQDRAAGSAGRVRFLVQPRRRFPVTRYSRRHCPCHRAGRGCL